MKLIGIVFFTLFVHCAAGAASLDLNAPKTITAPKIEYNVKSSEIKTTGKTEITNTSGQRVTLVDSYIADRGDTLGGNDIELWLSPRVYVRADNVQHTNDGTTSNNAIFTSCYGCDDFGNAWEISGSTVRHNMTDHMIKFNNPVFWAYGVPIFWFPYLEIPDPTIRHKSGILLPDFNSTNKMGTQFNLPVYISISDTHDFTATFSYITKENPLFKLEHRLNTEHARFRTKGSFTRNRAGENRWHIFNDDVIEMGENLRTTIYLERASDKTYLQKYGFYSDQPYLDSGAKVELFGQSGYVIADAHIFQELRSYQRNRSVPSGDILPNIRGTYQTDPFFNETYMTLNADILGISGDNSSNQRAIGDVRITSPWTLWGGNRITAAVSARYDIYNFDDTKMVNNELYSGFKSRFLPSGYLEWSLPLVKTASRWTQILEPRARITAMRELGDYEYAMNNDSAGALLSDATLFSNNRFSGLDLWENGTFADYGARWAMFDQSGHNFEVFLGQTYDFTDIVGTDLNSGFHNGLSDYVGRVGYKNNKWVNVSGRFRFAKDDLSLRHIEAVGRFGTSRNYFSAGHIWAAQFIDAQTMDKDINEISGGFNVYLTQRVGIKFNAIYNITDEKFQRHTGGIFYNHPCYFLALEYRRDNAVKGDYVGSTTFQFRFGVNIDGQTYNIGG